MAITPYNAYQSYYPQYYSSQVQQNNQQNGIIWVQGEAGAKSYMVAPNNTVQLWDSESQTIYLKSADASGMPSMRILDYTIRSSAPNSPVNAFSSHREGIPTMNDLKALQGQIDALQERMDKLSKASADSSGVKGE